MALGTKRGLNSIQKKALPVLCQRLRLMGLLFCDAGEMLLDIEARIGELYDALPATKGNQFKQAAGSATSKIELIKKAGIDDRRARQSSEVHRNPEIVAKIKAQARHVAPR